MNKIDWRSCESMSEDIELEKMEEWCSEISRLYSNHSLSITEIGSFRGKTAALLAQFGVVFCIDLWSNVDDGEAFYDHIGTNNLTEFLAAMRRLKLINRKVFPIISSSEILNHIDRVHGTHIAFIDGSHKYEYVKADLLRISPRIKEGGIIILHDYKRPGWGYPPYDPNHPHHGPADPWSGVSKAVDEFLEQNNWEIKEHFLGIVALKRGGRFG